MTNEINLEMEAVDATRVNWVCDCGGYYKAVTVKESLLDYKNNPTEYMHRCMECDDVRYAEYKYPRIIHTTRTHINLTTAMLGTSMFCDD